MHPRLATPSAGASRTALRSLLLLAGLLAPAVPALAHGYWYLSVPPEALLRWNPRSAAEAANPPRHFDGVESASGFARASGQPHSTATDQAVWDPFGSPGVRFHHESVLDEATNRLVIFGGWGDPASQASLPLAMACDLGPSPNWETLGAGSLDSPRSRFGAAVAIDPVHHALVVFGGQATDGSGDLLDDLWSLSLAPGGTWTRLQPVGPGPGPRRFASLCFDAARGRLLLAGGHDSQFLPEFWELRLTASPAWRRLEFVSEAGARLGAVLADPIHGDAWSIAWENEIRHLAIGDDAVTAGPAIAVQPDPDQWGAPSLLLAGFDPVERRLLWFGLQSGGPVYAFMNVLRWLTLDGSPVLSPVQVDSACPPNRYLCASTWDAGGRRLFLTGGFDDDVTYFGDAWRLTAPPSIPTGVVATLRTAESDSRGVRITWLARNAARERAIVERSPDAATWTGEGDARLSATDVLSYQGPPLAPGTTAAFRLVLFTSQDETATAPVWLDGPGTARLALAPAHGPTGPDLAVTLSLAPGAPARLRVLDAAGRVVAESGVPEGARGWNFGRAPAPGLYFAELTQGDERRVAKLVTRR
jgi:hypothetical protein